jgi:ubiquinone biosynthesis protein
MPGVVISGLFNIVRLARIGFVMTREGVLSLIEPAALPPLAAFGLRIARGIERPGVRNNPNGRLAAAFTRLGPNYVKLGQFLATRPDVVGMAAARDLEALQDKMPAFEDATARAMIEATFGQPADALYAHFGPAIAAASVAQVHKATIEDGDGRRFVAVKILRPQVRERFLRDLELMRFVARQAERFLPSARRLKPLVVVETLARSVAIEMDLRLEAAALSEFGENTRADDDFRLPKVDWERTGRDVMTTEWIDAVPLSDMAAIEASAVDRRTLARTVIQSFLKHAMRDGFFHADMHQGNLFADAQNRLVAVDCGIMGRIGLNERRFLAEILFGFITRNYRRVAEVHFEAGYVPRVHSVDDFAQAIRAIGEPIHSKTADQISMAKLLTLLFEITALFDMKTRAELVMLQKTMIVVEGVARKLDPQLDIWSTAEPVVRGWLEENLGPVGIIRQGGVGARRLLELGGRLPGLLERGERIVSALETQSEGGFRLAPETVDSIGRAEGRGNLGLSIGVWVLVAVAIAAWIL